MPKEKVDLIVAIIAVSLFILLLMIAVMLFFRIYLKRKNKLLIERERLRTEYEKTLLQSKLEIQEQTFQYISQELHDNIGQVLSLVSINLNTLDAPNESRKIIQMDELLGKALSDLRTLSHSLDADHIRDHGWVPAVRKLLSQLENTGRFIIKENIEDNLPAPGSEKSIILFRMIQEVISNITKHAEASEISFNATRDPGGLLITITDNGKGFDENILSAGAGLRNLQNRAKLISADLKITSQQGTGTTVQIFIKIENIEHPDNQDSTGR
jgi:signal transduction histidine kinase